MTDFDPIAELERQLDGILEHARRALAQMQPDYERYVAGVDALIVGAGRQLGEPYRGRHVGTSFEEWISRLARGRV